MSSSPPTDTPAQAQATPWRPRFAGWSLRTRLLAAILVLLALVLLVIGVASTLALRQFLIEQLDDQVSAAASRAADGPHGPPQGHDLFPPGTATGTVGARIAGGRVEQAAVLDPIATDADAHGQLPLSAAQQSVLLALPVDGTARTRVLGDLGEYRMVAKTTPRGEIQIAGLPLKGVRDTVSGLAAIEAAVAGAGLLVAGLASAGIVRVSLRPLRRVAATASRVTELPLDRGEVVLSVRVPDGDTDPRTEVGQVGAALNRMLGHVATALAARHASEMRVRQFVADASHELRTPLAAIRGYAEVARRGRDAVPPDVAHALRRVESEGTRMTSLVDDLLLLARLDSGRPLDRDPVDLSRLVVDAVGDAHAAGPDHRWLLEMPQDAVTATGDAPRLHQVLANLLANARTHTPIGTTVTTTLSRTDGTAVLTILDDGPGIPAELQSEIFERFARGDTSRSRTAGGTGLGLAIVAAVIEAHHGTIEVTSRPGRTAFVVRLPLELASVGGGPSPD
jgi:two-component system OmpR family sensor kinase